MDKEKPLETEDYNLAKMKILFESALSDKESIHTALKRENGRKFNEQNMFIKTMVNMIPNHTYLGSFDIEQKFGKRK